MRATIEIDTDLLTEARGFALREKCSLQSLVIEGLQYFLKSKAPKAIPRQSRLTISSTTGGVRNGVNLSSSSAMRDLMDFS